MKKCQKNISYEIIEKSEVTPNAKKWQHVLLAWIFDIREVRNVVIANLLGYPRPILTFVQIFRISYSALTVMRNGVFTF